MEKELKNKLRSNGVELTVENDSLFFKSIKKSTLKYYLFAAMIIPMIPLNIFFNVISMMGILVAALGIGSLLHGLKSVSAVKNFNNNQLEINPKEITLNEQRISLDEIVKFKSKNQNNPLFYNVDILASTKTGDVPVLKIWNKQSKYLNEDKTEIVKLLNGYLEQRSLS